MSNTYNIVTKRRKIKKYRILTLDKLSIIVEGANYISTIPLGDIVTTNTFPPL